MVGMMAKGVAKAKKLARSIGLLEEDKLFSYKDVGVKVHYKIVKVDDVASVCWVWFRFVEQHIL